MVEKKVTFADLVWDAARHVGPNAVRVVDVILPAHFPQTYAASETEGVRPMLRNGCVQAAKRVLRRAPDADQIDFSTIDPQFQEAAAKLHSWQYTVESIERMATVPELIANPSWLDEARKLMRRKGMECLEEARRLDELYKLVMEARGEPASLPASLHQAAE